MNAQPKKRHIEYFMPHEFYSVLKNAFFVHSGLSYNGGSAVTIWRITKANPAVVTVASWPVSGTTDLANGDKVRISGVVGMTEINQSNPPTEAYTVANCNKGRLTFELSGVNSTAYDTYAWGGTVKMVRNTFDNLDHLEGKSVVALADGYACPEERVAAGGNVTFDYYGNQVHAGLPYTSIVEPMKLHIATESGTARGKKQRVHKLTACFYETGEGVESGPDVDNLRPIIDLDSGILNTKDVPFQFPGNWKNEATLYLQQTKPLPMTILALVPRVSLEED